MGRCEAMIGWNHARKYIAIGTGCALLLVGVFLCVYFGTRGSSRPGFAQDAQARAGEGEGTVHISGTAPIGRIDDDFVCATLDWWPPDKCDYGTCSWGNATLLDLDLSNPTLLNAIKAFSPLKIRMGGTLQDRVTYETKGHPQPCNTFVKDSSAMFGFSDGCLPMSRWDELNIFLQKAGAVGVFGLNALTGRTIQPDGSAVGAWDSTNAEALMNYTVSKNYTIRGWELGNELCGNGIGTRVAADQYAADVRTLQNLVQKIYQGSGPMPLLIAPGGFFDAIWFTEFASKTSTSLQVITQHIYNLGSGVDDHLVEKILSPTYLNGGFNTLSSLRSILKSTNTPAIAWVGEAGGAYNSGQNHVSNAFLFSFWYLDQLGMASTYDTKTYCRQTLIGGNYGLLNTTTFVPNPDYYSALLFHRLMGRNVLLTSFNGTESIRAYAHCSKVSQGITILLINLSGHKTVQVHVSTDNATVDAALLMMQHKNKTGSSEGASMETSSKVGVNAREEYHLRAKDGDLHSQTMLLNGKLLAVNSTGLIPSMEPVTVNPSSPIAVAPYSIVFAHIPDIRPPACT